MRTLLHILGNALLTVGNALVRWSYRGQSYRYKVTFVDGKGEITLPSQPGSGRVRIYRPGPGRVDGGTL